MRGQSPAAGCGAPPLIQELARDGTTAACLTGASTTRVSACHTSARCPAPHPTHAPRPKPSVESLSSRLTRCEPRSGQQTAILRKHVSGQQLPRKRPAQEAGPSTSRCGRVMHHHGCQSAVLTMEPAKVITIARIHLPDFLIGGTHPNETERIAILDTCVPGRHVFAMALGIRWWGTPICLQHGRLPGRIAGHAAWRVRLVSVALRVVLVHGVHRRVLAGQLARRRATRG